MARKREFLPPPHLYCVTTLPSKKHCQSYSGLGEQATHKEINFVA